MLMEEEEAPPPPLRRPTPDHPPYSEMVQCAIRALAEPHGSTEPSISSYIEAHYDSLPWAHSKLLPYYLNKLVLACEIAKSPRSPNRYVLPGTLVRPNRRNPSSRAKRGRGRPKKVILCNADGEDDDRAKLVVSPNPKLEIVGRDPAVKGGRGRPRKITPHVDGEPNSESVQKGGGNGHELIVNPSPHPNPNTEILFRDPIIKCGGGKPWMVAPHADGEPNSESAGKGGGNRCGLIVNPSPNPDPEILRRDLTIKGGRGRPQKIAPHVDGELDSKSLEKDGANWRNLIVNLNPEILRRDLYVKGGRGRPRNITCHIDGEAKCGSVEKGSGNRGSLNVNPNPNLLRVGSPVKRRGRPPKVVSLDFNRDANHDPNSLFTEPELNCSGERRRLVLKLKRRKPEEIGGDGGDVTGGWMCLKEEQTRERELESVMVNGGNEEVLALQEKDLNAVEVDEHFEELLALQEKGLSGIKIEHDEGFLALQEKDLDWMLIDGNDGELLTLQENGSDEIKTEGQNEETLPLEANGLNGIKADEHNEELLLPFQVKKDSNGMDGNNKEILMLQEKDLNAIKPDERNGDLLALEEKNLEGTEIDEHNEELLVSKVVLDAKSSKSKSDQWSLHKKAKPKKTRRLWYEG